RGPRPRVQTKGRSRNGRGERGRGRTDGVLPVRRLEELVLRRPPRHGTGRRALLHQAEGGHLTVVAGPHARPLQAGGPGPLALATVRPLPRRPPRGPAARRTSRPPGGAGPA